MIKRNNLVKLIISVVLALFCWTFTCINIDIYYVYTDKVVFKLGYFIMALVCSALIFAFGAVKIRAGDRLSKILGIIAYVLSVFGAMNISVLFSDGFDSGPGVYFINILFYLIFAGLGLLISGSMRISAITALAVSYLFNASSFIVYSFRGSSLTPTDFYAFGTAMNVASNYEFKLKYQMITATIMTAVHMMIAFKFPLKLKFRTHQYTLRAAGAAAMAGVAVFIGVFDFSPYDVSVYDQYFANLTYGSAFSFYVNSTKLGLEKHDSYDPEELEQMLLSYGDEETENTEDKPNIIVIMNESFADLSVINDFDTNVDYMPFFNSLEKNTVKGQLFVSPFGGYTCNTEYEFLTGMSTGVLGSRAAPYLQMMFTKMPYSLNTHLKKLGYTTTALHPYYADGWNRNLVYDYLSFDNFVSIENFTDYSEYPEMLRGYISDKSSYDAVLNMLYEKDPDERKFIFNITMQNHGGYTDDTFESEVFLENMRGSYPETEQYLTLIKKSDEAFEYLINSLKSFDEPTIVLMFGDHMPNVEKEFYEELYGATLDNLGYEQAQKRYFIPFALWANYDIEEEDDVHTSPCYLSNILMEEAGLPKSRVQLYLDDLEKDIAQINPMGYYDAGGYFHDFEDTERLDEYYDLQYALLTGEQLSYDFDYGNDDYVRFGNLIISPHFIMPDDYENYQKQKEQPSESAEPSGSPSPSESAEPSSSPDVSESPKPSSRPERSESPGISTARPRSGVNQ